MRLHTHLIQRDGDLEAKFPLGSEELLPYIGDSQEDKEGAAFSRSLRRCIIRKTLRMKYDAHTDLYRSYRYRTCAPGRHRLPVARSVSAHNPAGTVRIPSSRPGATECKGSEHQNMMNHSCSCVPEWAFRASSQVKELFIV